MDLSSGSSIATFNCSVSDRQYICSDGNSVQYRTFSSVEGALLGVVNPPGGGGFGFFPSQRGLLRNKATSVSNPNNVLYNFTYTYDPSHRLVSATDEINSTSRSYGDYDLNGFPLDVDGSSANYSYDSGRKRPKGISVSGGPGILFDSKGWAIEFAEGLDSIAFENSGSLQICD